MKLHKSLAIHARSVSVWQVLMASVAVSVLGALSAAGSKKKHRRLYSREFRQAPWSPPAWAFGPAWSVNNFFLLLALRDVLAHPEWPEYKKLVYLQTGIWLIYFSFGFVYFKKKSPLLAAFWTLTDTGLAWASVGVAAARDKKLALKFLPLAIWTSFASSVGDYQALYNPDPVFKTEAPLSL